jgi:hypothetical protein
MLPSQDQSEMEFPATEYADTAATPAGSDPEPEPEPEPEEGSVPDGDVDPLGVGGGAVADPLSAAAADPLSQAAAPTAALPSTFGTDKAEARVEEVEEGFMSWAQRRDGILTEYQTDKTITIANLKNIDNTDNAAEAQAARASMPQSRARGRLEELENAEQEDQRQMLLLNCAEYTQHIKQLNEMLTEAWKGQERVKAVKLAIQNAKLLADATVLQFYPSMFVLVTDLLDNFGRLVFDRIRERGAGVCPQTGAQLPPLGQRFSHKDVSDLAKETCRNWFYKIASVKELLPRVFVEVAIVKCYMFIEPEKRFPRILQRLATTLRGIGDPLVACFARAYLARKGRELVRAEKGYVGTMVEDTMFTLKVQVPTQTFKDSVIRKGCSMVEYYNLWSPALDYMFHCLGYNADSATYDSIWQLFNNVEGEKSSIVLNFVLRNFPASNFMGNALQMTQMLKETDATSYPRHRIYITWAKCMVESAPPKEKHLKILNEAWKYLTKQDDLLAYLSSADAYIEYVLVYFGDKECNVMLKDVIAHVKHKIDTIDDTVYDKRIMPILTHIVNLLLSHRDFGKLVFLDKFLPLLDLFRKDAKYDIFKSILAQFAESSFRTNDPVVIHAMFDITRNLHDVLDGMAIEDEKRQVSALIIKFIDKVSFGKDLEKSLNFYVDVRQACTNLDLVVNHVVLRMAGLGIQANQLVKGKHNKRTTAFVKACMAACYVTIPTSENVITRLHLFLKCGQVALVNGLVTQAESFMKQCIQTVKEIPAGLETAAVAPDMERNIASFVERLCHTLICMPGHPENGPQYLVQALCSVISKFPWNKLSTTCKNQTQMRMMKLLCSYCQDKLPYRITGVVSNDVLFPSPAEKAPCVELLNKTLQEVLGDFGQLKEAGVDNPAALTLQAKLMFELHEVLVESALFTKGMATLAFNLFMGAHKVRAQSLNDILCLVRKVGLSGCTCRVAN